MSSCLHVFHLMMAKWRQQSQATHLHAWVEEGEREQWPRYVFFSSGIQKLFQKLFSGLIYTAMARLCVCQCPTSRRLRNVSWLFPATVGKAGQGEETGVNFATAGNVCHRAIEALLENSGSSGKASYYLLIMCGWMKTSQTLHSRVHDIVLKKKVTIFFDRFDLGFF